MLTQADLASFLHAAETTPVDCDHLSALETMEEVLGYAAQLARAQGQCEEDMVELLVRAGGTTPDEVRRIERVLRQLGYRAVSDRLRAISGRRKHSLKPLAA